MNDLSHIYFSISKELINNIYDFKVIIYQDHQNIKYNLSTYLFKLPDTSLIGVLIHYKQEFCCQKLTVTLFKCWRTNQFV